MSSRVILIWLFVTGLIISWVDFADSRPAAVASRNRLSKSVLPRLNGGANKTTMWSLSYQQMVELERSVGIEWHQSDTIIHAKYVNGKKEQMIDQIAKIMTSIDFIVKNKAMSRKEANELIKFLLSKAIIYAGNKKELIHRLNVVVQKHPSIVQSLKVLRQNIQDQRLQMEAGDYVNVLLFIGMLREIDPSAQFAEVVTPETVLLKLGAYVGEMVIWPDAARENFILLLKTYIRERADASGPAEALKAVLKNRGYTDVEAQVNWMRDAVNPLKVKSNPLFLKH